MVGGAGAREQRVRAHERETHGADRGGEFGFEFDFDLICSELTAATERTRVPATHQEESCRPVIPVVQ